MFDNLVVVGDVQFVGINRSLTKKIIITSQLFIEKGKQIHEKAKKKPKKAKNYLKRPPKLVLPDRLHHCVLQIHQLICRATRPV